MRLFELVLLGCLLGLLHHAVSAAPSLDEALPNEIFDGGLKGEKIPLKTDDEVADRESGYSITEQQIMAQKAEKYQFQTEVTKLMSIIVNSLYSNRDVYLREAISNASDALDKIRFEGVTNSTALGTGELAKLDIRIRANKEDKTLTITDRGVGMTKEDLINNLGTIAQSGTREFVEKLASGSGDSNLIGQFGVGFYSYFLVADRVTVTTKNNNDEKQWIWESTSGSGYSIVEDPHGNTLGRGTRITLHLKDEALVYLEQSKLKSLIEHYSEFINFPIYLWTETSEEIEVPVEETEKDVDNEDLTVEDVAEEENTPKTRKETVVKSDWEQINNMKPIWTRKPSSITTEEYNAFYQSFTKDKEDPLAHVHFNAEGDVAFRSILYIPARAPENLYMMKSKIQGLKMYVKRVFISDNFADIMPAYLLFIRGVVDSDDLPLNVSREILQQDRALVSIRKKLVRKAIAMIQELAKDKKKYDQFWKEYSAAVKLGVVEDKDNRSRLSKLLRYSSSAQEELTSLDEYIARMKKDQTDIYFIAGENKDTLAQSPLLERLLKRGFEVLYMTEAMDEYVMSQMEKYDGKYKLVNIAKEGLKLPGETTSMDEEKKTEEEFKALTVFLKETLGDKVDKVVLTKRLVSSPSALVTTAWGATANMERIAKAQALGKPQANFMYKARRVLEINPKHPILVQLNKNLNNAPEGDQAPDTTSDIALLLYDTAALNSGFALEEPADFAKRINRLLKINLNLDPEAEAPLEDIPLAEEKTVEEHTEKDL